MKIIVVVIIILALALLGAYLYVRNLVNNTPSIIGNDYDRKMNEEFQKRNGLEVTGELDEATQKAIDTLKVSNSDNNLQ